jgi:reactive chlorine resistance protein C
VSLDSSLYRRFRLQHNVGAGSFSQHAKPPHDSAGGFPCRLFIRITGESELRKIMDTTNQFASTEEPLVKALLRAKSRTSLERAGIHVSRYGLVVTLLLIGVLKFTAGEAQGIQPLVANSPLMFWLYRVFTLQSVSNLIGVIEIVVALFIALRPWSARVSFIGSIGATITFVLTVSFLFSTPGAFQFSHGFPLLGDAGQFLIKDLVLLGASIWTAAEARRVS